MIKSKIIIIIVLFASSLTFAGEKIKNYPAGLKTIVWNNENKYSFSFDNIAYFDNFFWDGNITSHLEYKGAARVCSGKKYVYNGIIFDNFELLPTSEIKTFSGRNYKEIDWLKQKVSSMKGQKGAAYFAGDNSICTKDEYYPNNNKKIYLVLLDGGDGQGKCIRPEQDIPRRALCAMSEFKQDISEIAESMLEINLKHTSDYKIPEKPVKQNYPVLEKGEFETTAAYNSRVKQSMEMFDAEYQSQLDKWREKNQNEENAKNQKMLEIEKNREILYAKAFQKAIHLKHGNPRIGNVKYDADKQVFDIQLISTRGGYAQTIKQFVSIKYAREFKSILTKDSFTPTVEFVLDNGQLKFKHIVEIQDPDFLVEQTEFDKAFAIRDAKESISRLQSFVGRYPASSLAPQAKERINLLEDNIRLEEIKEKERKRQSIRKEELQKQNQLEREERESQSYASQKSVGDKVCKDFSGIFSETIEGYVERLSGDKVQIRISKYSALLGNDYPYNGLIWDDFYNWRSCSY